MENPLENLMLNTLKIKSESSIIQIKDVLKQLEELKDKSGLFILSASASNQSAFELEQLSQGLLTYCLLKTLKEGDVTDENKFLNVSKWFNETENLLSDSKKAYYKF